MRSITRCRTLFAIAALLGLTGLAPGPAVRAEVGKDKGQVTLDTGGSMPLPVVKSEQKPSSPNPRCCITGTRSAPAPNPPPDNTPCPAGGSTNPFAFKNNINEYPTYHLGTPGYWSWPDPGGGPDFTAANDQATLGPYANWQPSDIPTHSFMAGVSLKQLGTIQKGVCVGAVWGINSFGGAFVRMGGPYPPPLPPPAAVAALPPGMSNIAANIKKSWNIGSIGTSPTLPLPTFVNIPTCAWLNTGVPQVTKTITEEKTVLASNDRGSVEYTLRYTATVSPGPITWDFGDGISQGHETGPGSNPQTTGMPTYNAVTQTWAPGGCTVYHAYPSVNDPGRVITASQNVTIGITVSYNNGIGLVGPQALPCDGAAFCNVPVGAADGWSSGPHPVMQIQGVPYFT